MRRRRLSTHSEDSRSLLGQWNWTFDPDNPVEGVSNDEQWLCETFARHGFRLDGIEYGNWRDTRSYAIQHDWLALRRLPEQEA